MSVNVTKASLPPARRRLVELMQWTNFGRIEGMRVHGGQPVLDPLPRVVREIKIGGANGPRSECRLEDFLLKNHLNELFAILDDLGDGTVEVLEIKHGLPFRLLIARPPA